MRTNLIKLFLVLFSTSVFINNKALAQNDCKCVVYYCSGCVNNHLCPLSQPFSTYADALKSAQLSCPAETTHDIRCTGTCPGSPGATTTSNNNNGLVNASTDAIGKGIAYGDAKTVGIGMAGLLLNGLMNAGKRSAAEQEQLRKQQEEQQRIAAEQQRLNELERQRKAAEARIKFEKEKDAMLGLMKGDIKTSSPLVLKGGSSIILPGTPKSLDSKEALAYKAEQARVDKWMNANGHSLITLSADNGIEGNISSEMSFGEKLLDYCLEKVPITPLQQNYKEWAGMLTEKVFGMIDDAVNGNIAPDQVGPGNAILQTNWSFAAKKVEEMTTEKITEAVEAAGKMTINYIYPVWSPHFQGEGAKGAYDIGLEAGKEMISKTQELVKAWGIFHPSAKDKP